MVAFGTSAPELAVSLSAALKGSNDIAIGNVVGSNIFNLLVVLGLSAVIKPVSVEKGIVKRLSSFTFCSNPAGSIIFRYDIIQGFFYDNRTY